jgi:hypothetical protein
MVAEARKRFSLPGKEDFCPPQFTVVRTIKLVLTGSRSSNPSTTSQPTDNSPAMKLVKPKHSVNHEEIQACVDEIDTPTLDPVAHHINAQIDGTDGTK